MSAEAAPDADGCFLLTRKGRRRETKRGSGPAGRDEAAAAPSLPNP